MKNMLITGTNDRMLLSFSLFVVALLLALIFRTPSRFLKAGAMLVCVAADMMLARYEPFTRVFGYSFEKGAIMFMAAHLLYIAAFTLLIYKSGKPLFNIGFWAGAAVLASVILTIVVLYFKNPFSRPSMLFLGIVYAVIIGTLCIAVFSYAASKKGFAFVAAAGVVSFMISDMIIGLTRIGGIEIAGDSDIIWFYYPIGQLLLIL